MVEKKRRGGRLLLNSEKIETGAAGVTSSSWVLWRASGRAGSSKEDRGRQLSPQGVTSSIEDRVQPILSRDSEVAKDGPNNTDWSVRSELSGGACFRVYTHHQTTLSSKCRHCRVIPKLSTMRILGHWGRALPLTFGLTLLMAG